MTKKAYEGQLIKKNNSDLYLSNYEKPLNVIIQEDSEKYGNYVMIKYWVSDERLSESELDEKFLDAYYDIEKKNINYFEISEYLWKDTAKGCRHDIIKELDDYIGKYCKLDINYSKKSQIKNRSYI